MEKIEKLKEIWEDYKVFIILIAIGGLACIFFLFQPFISKSSSIERNIESIRQVQSSSSKGGISSSSASSSSSSSDLSDSLKVDVKGAVKYPGVYDLPLDSRVTDAIAKAGGLIDGADSKSINLAQKLKDEAVIYVAKMGEQAPINPASSALGTASEKEAGRTSEASDKKVPLNRASEEELRTVPGIGAKRAKDILDYRQEHGPFSSVDDLKKVSGIGQKSLEKLREHFTLD